MYAKTSVFTKPCEKIQTKATGEGQPLPMFACGESYGSIGQSIQSHQRISSSYSLSELLYCASFFVSHGVTL